MAINLAKANNSDVVLATDPDCDRVGIAIRDGNDYKLKTKSNNYLLKEVFSFNIRPNEKRTNSKCAVV